MKWQNDWPVINPDHEEVQYHYPFPIKPSQERVDIPHRGNFKFRDEFEKEKLNYNWVFLRTPREKWYDLQARKGFLAMQLRPESCAGNMNPITPEDRLLPVFEGLNVPQLVRWRLPASREQSVTKIFQMRFCQMN